MKRIIGPLCLAALWSACGTRVYINLIDAKAARGADDHVVVTATVQCEAVGYPDCSTLGEYCVEAQWVAAAIDGGIPDAGAGVGAIDTARACLTKTLGPAEMVELQIPSTKPIPKTQPLEIRFTFTSACGISSSCGAGNYLRGGAIASP